MILNMYLNICEKQMRNKNSYNTYKNSTKKHRKTFVFDARWCDRWDLNPYGCPHAPQTCASACSATVALVNTSKKYYSFFKIESQLSFYRSREFFIPCF